MITSNLAVTANYQAKLAAGGTPHWWLIEHDLVDALALDATFDLAELSDPLGKGHVLKEEYVLGTDPTNPISRFDLKCTPVAGGHVSLQWTGKAGRVYQVLRSTDMASPWQFDLHPALRARRPSHDP